MNLSVNGQSQVPPGFRFHPTEEELLHYYLRKKVTSEKIDLDVIRDVDLNKLEPWDIQGKEVQDRIGAAERLVLFQPQGQEVSDRNPDKPGDGGRILEGPRGGIRLDDNSPEPTQGTSLVGELNSAPEEGWVVCRVFKKKNYHKALESPHTVVQTHPGNDGVLDQILTYMGRSSSSSKQQNGAKNGNLIINGDDTPMQFSDAIQAARFLHLPPLETQSAMEILSSPTHASFEDMLAEPEPSCNNTEPVDDMKTGPGPADWVFSGPPRRLSAQRPDRISPKSYVADDLSDGLYFPLVDHHRPFGRPNNHHHNSQVNAGNEVEFWSYTNSSSSPSDPLSHFYFPKSPLFSTPSLLCLQAASLVAAAAVSSSPHARPLFSISSRKLAVQASSARRRLSPQSPSKPPRRLALQIRSLRPRRRCIPTSVPGIQTCSILNLSHTSLLSKFPN
nr:NAC domain-containing protein 43-like [Ipomoea batatas]